MTLSTSSQPESVCTRIARRLAQSVGERRYQMWFDNSARMRYRDEDNRIELAVPNRFVAEWIDRHFQSDLRSAVRHELGEGVELDVRVDPSRFTGAARPGGEADGASPVRAMADAAVSAAVKQRRASIYAPSAAAPGPRRSGGATLRHRLADFIVGPTNELAYAAACRLADDEAPHHAPLFIHGGCGLGKTHLLQGVCNRLLARQHDARVLYVTGEQFTNDYLAAIRSNKLEAFRARVRRLDLLAIDDVHFLANKNATQQEFLHSFDAIDLSGARLVMASDCHPKLINQFSEALVSRCVRGMVVEVRPPDVATRVKILEALAARRGLTLMETVVNVLAQRSTGSVREIEGTLTKLHALASLPGAGPARGEAGAGGAAGRAVGHTLLNQLLSAEAVDHPRKHVTFDTIVSVVAGEMGVSRTQMLGGNRHRHVVLARSAAIYLARRLTSMSYPEIAAAMGRTSHSTVLTAAQRLQRQLSRDQPVILPGAMATGPTPLSQVVQRLEQAILTA